MTGKKAGLRAFGSAAPRLEACVVEKCGRAGVACAESAAAALVHCTLSECGEEGVVVADAAALSLVHCTVAGCKGPGVDASGSGRVEVKGGRIGGNVGGVFMWGDSAAAVRGATVEGGPCHALLLDRDATADVEVRATGGSCWGLLGAAGHIGCGRFCRPPHYAWLLFCAADGKRGGGSTNV